MSCTAGSESTSPPVGPSVSLCVWSGSLDFKLGLSFVDNSHSEGGEGSNNHTDDTSPDYCGDRNYDLPNRGRRGLHGITPYGKRMVRAAAAILQQRHGKENLTFGTLTLPDFDRDQLLLISQNWAELKRRFNLALSRLLRRKGLDPDWVDVTEIQPKRWRRYKKVCLHLHYLHHGREKGVTYLHPGTEAGDPTREWAIHPNEIREIWSRVLGNLLQQKVDCSSATRIESVRLSAKNYLGKYMSKGGKIVQKVIDAGQEDYIPSAWYGVSAGLREEIKAGMTELTPHQALEFAENIDYLQELGVIEWYYPIYQDMWLPGELAPSLHLVGVVGNLSGEHALRFLKGELDEYGYRNWYLSDEYWATQDLEDIA